jgi:hypothetical protein
VQHSLACFCCQFVVPFHVACALVSLALIVKKATASQAPWLLMGRAAVARCSGGCGVDDMLLILLLLSPAVSHILRLWTLVVVLIGLAYLVCGLTWVGCGKGNGVHSLVMTSLALFVL